MLENEKEINKLLASVDVCYQGKKKKKNSVELIQHLITIDTLLDSTESELIHYKKLINQELQKTHSLLTVSPSLQR